MERGVKMGRRPKLGRPTSPVAARLAAGETTREIGRDLGVSHSTIARVR